MKNQLFSPITLLAFAVISLTQTVSAQPQIRLNPIGYDFGIILVGERAEWTAFLGNAGNEVLVIEDIYVEGEFFGVEFDEEGMEIQPNEYLELLVFFEPEEAGEYAGVLIFVSNDPDNPEVCVALMGVGVEEGIPIIWIEPEQIDFGEILVGDEAVHTITIYNAGEEDLEVAWIAVEGEYFSADNEGDFALEPGEQVEIAVTFAPEEAGEFNGTVIFYSNDPDQGEVVIPLTGTGISFIRVVPEELYFGEIWIGEAATRALTISNLGEEDLDISDIAVEGEYFSIDNEGDFVVEQGEQVEIAVAFAPEEIDEFEGTVTIVSNDPNRREVIIGLTGVGIGPGMRIHHVPDEYETIQAAINAAEDGDTVLVAPGEYVENIDFSGKNIIVSSLFLIEEDEDHITETVIDGDRNGRVITFENGETEEAVLVGFTIQNGTSRDGGGIFCHSSSPTIRHCYVSNNSALVGGGIYCQRSNAIIANCAIRDNSSLYGGGGGIRVGDGSSPTISYCLFSGNYGGNVGGFLWCTSGARPTFINCTIVGNRANNHGSAFLNGNSTVTFINCVMWDNSPQEIYMDRNSNSVIVSYSDVEGGEDEIINNNGGRVNWGEGNIDEDPLFVDAENNNFHLRVNSPCIDTGDPESPDDPDGTRADMGAYYFHQDGDNRRLRVTLSEGWNLISINVSPGEEFYIEGEDRGPDVILMLDQLRIDEENHHVEIFKNVDGEFYLPAWDYNGIAYWNLLEGFQIKVDEDIEATWSGDQIPADVDIHIAEGWNMIAYFPTYDLDAGAPDYYVLSPIIDHVIIAKDADGAFMYPAWEFSNMPPWRETQGYQVKVDEDVVLNYPEEPEDGGFAFNTPPLNPPLLRSGGGSARYFPGSEENFHSRTARFPGEESKRRAKNTHRRTLSPTGQNMSVLIKFIQNSKSKIQNFQIAAFTPEGQLVGESTVDGEGRCGLAVWGDDPTTAEVDGLREGEVFMLRLGTATDLEVTNIYAGPGCVYMKDDYTVLDVAVLQAVPDDFYLSEAFPNPFNNTVSISIRLNNVSSVILAIYDIEGRVVEELLSTRLEAGSHILTWSSEEVPNGLYFARLDVNGTYYSTKMIMLK